MLIKDICLDLYFVIVVFVKEVQMFFPSCVFSVFYCSLCRIFCRSHGKNVPSPLIVGTNTPISSKQQFLLVNVQIFCAFVSALTFNPLHQLSCWNLLFIFCYMLFSFLFETLLSFLFVHFTSF